MYSQNKKTVSIAVHPKLRHILLKHPTQESLSTIIKYQLFNQTHPLLAEDILRLLPTWEQQALEGNEGVAALIHYMAQQSLSSIKEQRILRANLLRIRILASTPGSISFTAAEIQENLIKFLNTSDVLADLPELKVVSFSENDIKPLSSELSRLRLSPHSRRYIQNLFHPECREAILSVLAHLTKNYPILSICQKAYALMLSLDNPDIWGNHPFCIRLIANRVWDSKLMKTNKG